MRITDLLRGRERPTRVAAVYANRESALAAAEAAKADGDADVQLVGPLEQVIGNQPSASVRGAWAVVVQPDTYDQSRRVVRALRRPWRRRASDGVRGVAPQSKSPAAAGLATDRR